MGNMSATTLGTSSGLLREKDSIEVVNDGCNASVTVADLQQHYQQQAVNGLNANPVPGVYGVQHSMTNNQPGNVTIDGLSDDEINYVDRPQGANPNDKTASGSR